MKRKRSVRVWIGFVIALIAALSYVPFFAQFPSTRDIPWVNFLLFALAAFLLVTGTRQIYREPHVYRGKVSGPLLSAVSLVLLGLFCFVVFVFAKRIPSASNAIGAGQMAPSFTLPDAQGRPVELTSLLKAHRGALLIFYRGYW